MSLHILLAKNYWYLCVQLSLLFCNNFYTKVSPLFSPLKYQNIFTYKCRLVVSFYFNCAYKKPLTLVIFSVLISTASYSYLIHYNMLHTFIVCFRIAIITNKLHRAKVFSWVNRWFSCSTFLSMYIIKQYEYWKICLKRWKKRRRWLLEMND